MQDVFEVKFIQNLPDDDLDAWLLVETTIREAFAGKRLDDRILIQISAFLSALNELRPLTKLFADYNLPGVPALPPLTTNTKDGQQSILSFLDKAHGPLARMKHKLNVRQQYLNTREKYLQSMPAGFSYEFSDSDYDRIQELINELRDITSKSSQIEPSHKRRLLRKIESLQQELHKRMSNLDRFWGLLGDAGVVLGKFGGDIKPLTDRLGEMFVIVIRTMQLAHGLPVGPTRPLLAALNKASDAIATNGDVS